MGDSILENILKESFLSPDLLRWLKSSDFEKSELFPADNSEFVNFFLNYIRINCSWILCKPPKHFYASKFVNQFSVCDSNIQVLSKIQENINSSVEILPKHDNPPCHHNPVDSMSNQVENSFQSAGQNFRKIISKTLVSPKASTSVNVPDITDTDIFPSIEKSFTNFRTKRRITPTPVQISKTATLKYGQSEFANPGIKVENDIFMKTPFVEAYSDFKSEREMLKITKNTLLQNSSLHLQNKSYRVNNSHFFSISCEYVIPDPDYVSDKNKIEIFAEIYSLLLTHALVPNIISELFFIFKLITAKVVSNSNLSEDSVFCSVHNCVYFAILVLNKQYNLLSVLDGTILTLLSEIPFMEKFSPELVTFFKLCQSSKVEPLTNFSSLHYVPFLVDKDSKSNFSDEKSFFSFKKQRDLFFELLQEWQQHSLDYVDYKFERKFSHKAKSLISSGSTSANLYHLAVLFQSQLITSCLCLEVNVMHENFFNETQKNFPGKIEKLQERFTMPLCNGVLNPTPKFNGMQKFFCELIEYSSSPSFNQHLMDVFISKILELNNDDVFSEDELSSTSSTKQKYIFLLHTLRLLGKFLGYLYFLPYKYDDTISDEVSKDLLNHRKSVALPLNVTHLLEVAIQQGKTILTVPWVIEFLSMMDPIAIHLPELQESFKVLTVIYQKNLSTDEVYNGLFLKLLIGWLFDILHYDVLNKSLKNDIKLNECNGLDSLQLIDKHLIHSCCPYLVEFKILINNFVSSFKHKQRKVRKITPLSTTTNSIHSCFSTTQKIEKKLEETFMFFNPSLKEAIEFVSELVASKCMRKMQLKVEHLKTTCLENIGDDEWSKTSMQSKQELKLDALIEDQVSKSLKHLDTFIRSSCEEDINKVMPLLLLEDIKPQVLKVCCQLSFRLATDMLREWWNKKPNSEVIKSDIKSKIQNQCNGRIIEKLQ